MIPFLCRTLGLVNLCLLLILGVCRAQAPLAPLPHPHRRHIAIYLFPTVQFGSYDLCLARKSVTRALCRQRGRELLCCLRHFQSPITGRWIVFLIAPGPAFGGIGLACRPDSTRSILPCQWMA